MEKIARNFNVLLLHSFINFCYIIGFNANTLFIELDDDKINYKLKDKQVV